MYKYYKASSNLRRWTQTAIDCYNRHQKQGSCKGCELYNALESGQCKMIPTIIELVRLLEAPKELKELSPALKQTIDLYIDGFTKEEIAIKLKVSTECIRGRIGIIKKRYREQLLESGYKLYSLSDELFIDWCKKNIELLQ